MDISTINLSSMPPREPIVTSGGESVIYKYSDDVALKIYKPHIPIEEKEKRVKSFLEMPFSEEILSPSQLVLYRGSFKGFGMVLVPDSKTLYQYMDEEFLRKQGLSNKNLLEIVLKYAKLLKKLHKQGIIIGDICPYNVLIENKNIFLPDVDSWGIEGVMQPAAFKEDYLAPESFKGKDKYEFSQSTDLYSFAVMAFEVLAKIHPFGGCWQNHNEMKISERAERKISVLGKHQINLPRFVKSWDWMSPELIEAFLEIFEGNRRTDIIGALEENLRPCNKAIKITVKPPEIIKPDMSNAPSGKVIFEASDVKKILDRYTYISTNNELVHISTNKRVAWEISFDKGKPRKEGKQRFFSIDGKYIYFVDENSIDICNSNFERELYLPKKNNGVLFIQKDRFYYLNDEQKLIMQDLTGKDEVILKETMDQIVFTETFDRIPIVFAIDSKQKRGILLSGGKKILIPLDQEKQMPKECAVKYDYDSFLELIMYRLPKDKVMIQTYKKGKKMYEKELLYRIPSLSGTCFCNNIIYAVANGKLLGIDYSEDKIIEFSNNYDFISKDSKIEFSEGGFIITTRNKIWKL